MRIKLKKKNALQSLETIDKLKSFSEETNINRLNKSPEILQVIFNNSTDLLMVTNFDGKILLVNPTWHNMLGYYPIFFEELLNKIHPEDQKKVINAIHTVKIIPNVIRYIQYRIKSLDDTYLYFDTIISSIPIKNKKYLYLATRDISKRILTERALQISNEKLACEEKILEEKNAALKEILKHIDEEKKQINAQLQANVDKLISPVLQTLYERVSETDKLFIKFLESCLNDITSPFINRLESKFSVLTTREIEISNMIKNGYTSKDIAATLNISLLTVHKFRQQIRKKLQLNNQKINLVSYLKSI